MSGFSAKPIIIDGYGHLLGRLATVIAKTVLRGDKVVVVRCERLNISGNFFRAKLKYLAFLRKRTNVNPARGPFHHRAPSKILWRTVRGMLPHKTVRGKMALNRLRAYEGCPRRYEKKRRLVVPGSMRILCLKPGRKYCEVGRLSHEVGWKYQDVMKRLEARRFKRLEFGKLRRASLKKLTRQAEEDVRYSIGWQKNKHLFVKFGRKPK